MNIPTIRVMPWGADQGEYVVINEADFDPAVHTRFEAGGGAPHAAPRLDPPAPKKRAAKRKARK